MDSIRADALGKAHLLASVYGHRLDRPVVYTQGVALTARLELAQIDPSYPDPTAEITSIVRHYVADAEGTFSEEDGTANYAGVNWASEMGPESGYEGLLVDTANRFLVLGDEELPSVLDRDFRVEDMFFMGTLMQRASRITGDAAYAEEAVRFMAMCAERLMQANGLYWHCLSSPYFWGRGNGFAALGFSETLKASQGKRRETLESQHIKHLEGLRTYQDPSSGMWRQVIDRSDTYLEMSATSMIGIAIATGITNGWLDRASWSPSLESAWRGVSGGIDAEGRVSNVCVGTGPLESLNDYLIRDSVTGFDDRGGAMVLWFAVETARAFS